MAESTAERATSRRIVMPPGGPGDFAYMRLDWLARSANPRNPKDHDVGEIVQSIVRHGFVGAVTIDQATGVVVAGHGRIKALHAMLLDGYDPPERIAVAEDAMWLVPTHSKWFPDQYARDAYTVGDNQTTIKGGWEEAKLVELLAGLHDVDPVGGLKGTGFDADDLDGLTALLAGLDASGADGEADDDQGAGAETVTYGVVVHVADVVAEREVQALLKEHGHAAKRLSDGGG